ncbi:MAG: hypothetical protein DMD46_00145 [Gemmatimonadetes bacterium]|nr:MAG: hypothetical protein DMD46_00145 [Gemmatimonadota bacterium]
MSKWPLAVAVAVITSACATLRGLTFQDPQIELREIEVVGVGLTGGTLNLAFDVYNPNDYRIRSTRMEVGIDLEGRHFGDALLERPLDLSPTNHSRVVLPVAYAVTGRVSLDTPLGDKAVALTGKGNVPLAKLLK